MITVFTLALNEEHNLPAMLASVPPAWEIVVADGGSTDASLDLAKKRGCTVVAQDLEAIELAQGNFDVARNAAATLANTEWILFLDADERLTPDLVAEMNRRLAEDADSFAAFSLPRTNLFWGKPGRILGEDRHIRLVRRGVGSYEGENLHRPIRVEGRVGEIEQPLLHNNVESFGDVWRRLRRYAPQQAKVYSERISVLDIARRPMNLFRYYYWRNQARKDGVRGLVMSCAYSLEHAITLALAWARSRRR